MRAHCVVALALLWAAAAQAEPVFSGRFVWQSADPAIGGMSAIEVTDDGNGFIALSDRGFFATGTFVRNPAGQITAITSARSVPVLVTGYDAAQNLGVDSEGIAVAPDGTIFVSFEGKDRVAAFAGIAAKEMTLPTHAGFAALQDNSALEALAIDSSGALYALPERSGRYDRPFPVFRFRDGIWDIPHVVPRIGTFLIVGADVGPDGLLYVLERDFTGFGFLNRLRRINLDTGQSETIPTDSGHFGNLEGISVWRNAKGELVLTMISDNNYGRLIPTEIVEFRIDG